MSYDVVVTNANGSAISAAVQVTIDAPSAPLLMLTWENLAPTTYAGGSLTLSATFSGTLPISYQWLTNSGSGDFPIPGATNSTLTLLKLQPSSAGSIRLAATNALGSNTTSIATITILPALPAPTAAEPYAFAVIGNHPRVYWRFSETNAAGAGNVPVYDYSGNGYDATYGLNSTVNVPGPQSPTFVGSSLRDNTW